MRNCILLCFSLALLFTASTFAKEKERRKEKGYKEYKSAHYIIHSDLDPRYIEIAQANAEAFYENMAGTFFSRGWSQPLTIYYSKTMSDTFRLLCKHGHKEKGSNVKTRHSYYITRAPAIYTNQEMNNGFGTLFHEITHHFVRLNFKDPPAWFNEGLACFFGNETKVIKGKIAFGQSNPWRDKKLRERIEKGVKPNIKRLFAMNTKQLYSWPIGYHFSRAFFHWLYNTGNLEKYLRAVQMEGYEFSVLEQTLSKPYKEIRTELLDFMKKYCYAGAYYYDGRRVRGSAARREAFQKALELNPDYQKAQLELARCYYRNKDYEKCRVYLGNILDRSESSESRGAFWLQARSYYSQGNFAKALEFYQKALEYSDCYEYNYNLYYWIACCYHYLNDRSEAKKFYKEYLDNNWEPEESRKKVEYAKEYQKRDLEESKEQNRKSD